MARKYDVNADYTIAACLPVMRDTKIGLLLHNDRFSPVLAHYQQKDDSLEYAVLREMYFTGGTDAAEENLCALGEFRRNGHKGRLYRCMGFRSAHEKDEHRVAFKHPHELPHVQQLSDIAIEALIAHYENAKTSKNFVPWPAAYVQSLYDMRGELIEKGIIRPTPAAVVATQPSSTLSARLVPPNGSPTH